MAVAVRSIGAVAAEETGRKDVGQGLDKCQRADELDRSLIGQLYDHVGLGTVDRDELDGINGDANHAEQGDFEVAEIALNARLRRRAIEGTDNLSV